MVKNFFLIFILYFISACTSLSIKKNQNNYKPVWMNNPNILNEFYTIGSSPVNFQGVYMQRLEAINKAKADLSHSMQTYISSVNQNKTNIYNEKFTNKNIQKIKADSNTYLSDIYQIDAYFDENKRLYILMQYAKSKQKLKLRGLKEENFDKNSFLQSRCYSQEILNSINTKSKMHMGKPIWFYRPNDNNLLSSIGIAEHEEYMSFADQKRLAYILAKSELSKRQKTKMQSEHEILSIINDGVSGNIFQTSSIVKTSSRLSSSHIQDIWMDPKSCELYLWLVVNH